MSVEKTLKSPFVYELPISKLLVVSRGPKWRPRFSRTCLYSACEREEEPKTAIFVWTSYEQVVGNQSGDQNGHQVFLVHAYTAYVSVEKTSKSPFLYGLPMSKLFVISRGPKWRPRFSRVCL